jgi:hypothetical protein
MLQHRIHGMNQIKAGVNQGSIKIEHQQADAMRIKRAQETNHGEIRINQVSGVRSQERPQDEGVFLRPETLDLPPDLQ